MNNVLSCEMNGQGSNPTWVISFFFFQFNYSSFVGWLGLVGLGFSIMVSVNIQDKKASLVLCENFNVR